MADNNPYLHFPGELRALKHWCVYRLVADPRPDDPDHKKKPPFRSSDPAIGCAPTRPAEWSTFEEAVTASSAPANRLDGPGFMITPPFFGFDLDHCIEDGVIADYAREFIEKYATYCEVSPSGTGLHGICHGVLPTAKPPDDQPLLKKPDGVKGKRIEVYGCDRYFTVTGNHVPGTATEVTRFDKAQVTALWADALAIAAEDKKAATTPKASVVRTRLQRFNLLMQGDWTALKHGSQSEADLELCRLLADMFAGDAKQVDAHFRGSKLMRPKWDERRGTQTYGQGTLERALQQWRERTSGEDVVEVPAGVDFNALPGPASGLVQIPQEAMYGNAGRLASMLRCPMGFAYPAVLAAIAAHGFDDVSRIRPTLYVNLVGGVGSGKSVTRDYASRLFDLGGKVTDRTPASDRGLYRLFGDVVRGETRLLCLDEMRTMMSKGAIENSTLVPVLCELWSKNTAGGADKTADHGVDLRLNILGCTKISRPEEFPEVFGFATAHGFYDRCIFGVRSPDERWEFTPLEMSPVTFEPSKPDVPGNVFERMHAWRRQGENRDRLGEIVLRVAYLTSAANGDATVTDQALEAAFRFAEWQEHVRTVYQPAKGANEHQECVNAIIEAFKKAPGRAAKWRDLCIRHNWYRRFSRTLKHARRLLEDECVIVKDRESGKHFLAVAKEQI